MALHAVPPGHLIAFTVPSGRRFRKRTVRAEVGLMPQPETSRCGWPLLVWLAWARFHRDIVLEEATPHSRALTELLTRGCRTVSWASMP